MKLKHIAIIIPSLIFAGIIACGKDKGTGTPVTDNVTRKVSVAIDANKTYQTIENFAASDAWACQFVGNWPDAKRNAIADLLFSRRLKADGSPEGIGLSMWRFNLGAGSAQQGSQSGISDEWRRAESFLDDNGNYNWNLQAGQMWFLKAAKERGVSQFLAFTNSPPVHFTLTKKAFANASIPNLSAENYPSFANYLANAIKGIYEKTGVAFNYVSPVNEPQWDWSNGGQEGTPFTNNNISGIVKALDATLKTSGLQTKILVSEAGQYEFLYSAHGKADKGNQIDAFFNPSSADYIGNLSNVEKLIAAHSYFTTSTYAKAVSIRKEMASKLASTGNLKLWQSEYCILGDNENEIKGEGRDLGMASALYLARVVHNDLVNAGASAWHWWTAVSPYDYKDGLVYIDKNKTDGNYYASKMLWALGNFSRFIVPGSVRLKVAASNEPEVLVSSYKTPDNKLVTVVINSNAQPIELALTVDNAKIKTLTTYTTTSTKDLQVKQGLSTAGSLALDASSVTTLLTDFD